MRRPALRTSLPLTGHSLAARSALNSPDTARQTQRRRHSTGPLAEHGGSPRKCQLYSVQDVFIAVL